MALSPQLLQFKSSGVYRLEFDKSQVSSISAETIRLVAGHSRKGPYNTPVYIEDTETFVLIFGSIDKKLEKKGMFFHRSCLEALKRGPILAMNLADFDVNDLASYAQLSTAGSDQSAASVSNTAAYESFHNNDKFMFPSDEATLDTVGSVSTTKTAFNMVNLGKDNMSVIVRQAQDVKGFEITAREWYGEGNIPDGIDEFDYISDYMIEVLVYKGKFDSATMQYDPVYGDYFTADGLKKSKIAEFTNERQVNLIAQYIGSILPGFQDLEGNGLYIEQLINAETRKTGLFCAIDEDCVEAGNVDLIGHNTDPTAQYELLSYSDSNTSPSWPQAVTTVEFAGITGSTDGFAATIINDSRLKIQAWDSIGGTVSGDSVTLGDYDYDANEEYYVQTASGEYSSIVAIITSGGNLLLDLEPGLEWHASYADSGTAGDMIINLLTKDAAAGNREIAVDAFTFTGDGSATCEFTGSGTFPLSVGDYLPSSTAGKLARITRISETGGTYTVTCHRGIDDQFNANNDSAFSSYENGAETYKMFNLDKIAIADKNIQGCLTAFSSGGVKAALVDRDVIDLRYIVDSFGSYESGNLLNKSEFTSIAKERQNVSCILNAPTVGEFKKSSDPSFKDANTGKFDTRFVADGGDLSQNPTGIYSLPSIADGANYGFYYGPGLNVRENGKISVIPPAAYVSNNYIDKYTNALPWSLVAGPRRGIVSGTNVIGAEYAFDKSDRDNLEPFGINPIVFERGVGLNIKGNKTAQQTIKSALSSAHVREVLIYIENGLADILKGYLFEFNDAQTRLEIKTLADSFMASVMADQGVYAFKNVMDSTNNTSEVIDNNMGILDTYVEPVKGLEIIVHRTTVLNTGEIATGNF